MFILAFHAPYHWTEAKHQLEVEVKGRGKCKYSRRHPGRKCFRPAVHTPSESFSVNALEAVTKQFIGRLSFTHKNDYLVTAVAKVKDSVFSGTLLKH